MTTAVVIEGVTYDDGTRFDRIVDFANRHGEPVACSPRFARCSPTAKAYFA